MARKSYRIFDADLHHHFPSDAKMAEYIDPSYAGVPVLSGASQTINPHGAFRLDSYGPDGGVPASDPAFTVDNHMDRFGIDHAILSCGSLLRLSTMHDIDHAVAIMKAINDWTTAEWLPYDERYLGGITIAMSDPHESAAEIRRMAANPRNVTAIATGVTCPLGSSFLHPIWEACSETGIPFTLHQGGLGGLGALNPSMMPTTFMENHVDMCFPILPNITSLIIEGVLEKFPDLKLVFNEFGIAWLPFLMWRMDMEYRAAHNEVPWLRKLPSEYIAERIKFTTQPLEEPNTPTDLTKLLELFPAHEMLIFSSDYPHWDGDSPEYALRHVPEEWREAILFDNAHTTYGLEQRLGVKLESPAVVA